jgi:hypothetical protein
LNLLTAYTYGKSIDDLSAYRIQFGDQGISDPLNKRASRGLSAFDFRQNLTNSLMYELPMGKGKKFFSGAGRAADMVVGGWQIGSIVTLISGFPVSPVCGSGAVQNGDGACYPDNVGRSPNRPRGSQDPRAWFDTSTFVNRLPDSGFRFGNAGRNTIIGPGVINWDFWPSRTSASANGTISSCGGKCSTFPITPCGMHRAAPSERPTMVSSPPPRSITGKCNWPCGISSKALGQLDGVARPVPPPFQHFLLAAREACCKTAVPCTQMCDINSNHESPLSGLASFLSPVLRPS